jgi:hypothetical protein
LEIVMASFFAIHSAAIEAAWKATSQEPGTHFRIAIKEPIGAPCDEVEVEPLCYVLTLIKLPGRNYEPAYANDRALIADWNQRHFNTPDSAWSFDGVFPLLAFRAKL